jgi:hypothetical protein
MQTAPRRAIRMRLALTRKMVIESRDSELIDS